MKKLILIALLLTFASGMAIAQQQGGAGARPGMQGGPGMHGGPANFNAGFPVNPAERLTENLGLDEAQAAEIAGIFEEARLMHDEERQRARQADDEIRASVHAQIMALLTPEQQAQFEAQLQERDQLRQKLEDMRAEHGFGVGHGMGDCINN